ncbi:MAG: hypothetical protein ABIC40_08855 [bacterium]
MTKNFHVAVWVSIAMLIFLTTAVNADDTATSGTSTGATSGATGSTMTNTSPEGETSVTEPSVTERCIGTLISLNSSELAYQGTEGKGKYGSFTDLQNAGFIAPSYKLDTIVPGYWLTFLLTADKTEYAVIAIPNEIGNPLYFTWQSYGPLPGSNIKTGFPLNYLYTNQLKVFELKNSGSVFSSQPTDEEPTDEEPGEICPRWLQMFWGAEMGYQGSEGRKGEFGSFEELQNAQFFSEKYTPENSVEGYYISCLLGDDRLAYVIIAASQNENIPFYMSYQTILPNAEELLNIVDGKVLGPMSVETYQLTTNQNGISYELVPVEMPIDR